MKTKKVGTAGRFGSRYGNKQKKMVAELEKRRKKENVCPYCENPALKRLAAGIWYCKKCETKFAGGAFFPRSG